MADRPQAEADATQGKAPRVSCLMVTLATPERLEHVRASVQAYCRQSHPARELIVVVDAAEPASAEPLLSHLASLGRDDVHVTVVGGEHSLGALRNVSVAHARGEFLCQWDDDDLHHPDRVAAQLAFLLETGAEAVYLQDVWQYFPAARTLYWTNWRATEAGGHPGSLFCRRTEAVRYPETGPEASLGEDSALARSLLARGGVRYLAGRPQLYLYVSHGRNSWAMSHHRMLASELSISDGLLRRREAAIRAGLAPFDFDAPVEIRSGETVAFVHQPCGVGA